MRSQDIKSNISETKKEGFLAGLGDVEMLTACKRHDCPIPNTRQTHVLKTTNTIDSQGSGEGTVNNEVLTTDQGKVAIVPEQLLYFPVK